MKEWISRNGFLSEDEVKHNAVLVCERLAKHGFTLNAISAIVANMEAESTVNPAIWEGLQPYIGGYGLVQWTPYEKYSDWAGEDWQGNGDKECDRIAYEFENGVQYYPTDYYPIDGNAFKKSINNPKELASAFMYNYERPASYATQWYRQERALYWYDYLQNKYNQEPSIPEEPEHNKRGTKTCLLLHHE